jgi:DNA-binding XRE family transcriptional regulator
MLKYLLSIDKMKLKIYLETSGISQEDFSRLASITPAMVCYMTNGKRNPGLSLALKIQKLTKGKVRPEDWADGR